MRQNNWDLTKISKVHRLRILLSWNPSIFSQPLCHSKKGGVELFDFHIALNYWKILNLLDQTNWFEIHPIIKWIIDLKFIIQWNWQIYSILCFKSILLLEDFHLMKWKDSIFRWTNLYITIFMVSLKFGAKKKSNFSNLSNQCFGIHYYLWHWIAKET